MAASGESGASGGGGSTEEAFMTFYSEEGGPCPTPLP
uniref:DnaJ heat shock protein family (Hsp40) member C8 n=1 Tax=Mus musculus TaxID=10090 RepID=E9Q592_MOUSE